MGVLCLSMFCDALLCVHFSYAINLKRKRKLVALLLLSYRCIVTIYVLWLFLTVPLVDLWYAVVLFPDHSHFLIMHIRQCSGARGLPFGLFLHLLPRFM